jgi:hypothetical protein
MGSLAINVIQYTIIQILQCANTKQYYTVEDAGYGWVLRVKVLFYIL